jgi:hypothetical protein
VILVALEIDDRDLGVARNLAHVRIAFTGHLVVTDGDAVTVGGKDDAHVAGTLTVRDLRRVRIDEVGVSAELRHPGLERVARARRKIEEDHEQCLVDEQAVRPIGAELRFELGGHIKGGAELLGAPVGRRYVVLARQVGASHLVPF